MKKRTLYTILAIVIILGVYGYEYFLNENEKDEIIFEGKSVKNDTNEFYLPTSTTDQVIHHKGYS